jgi:hypothetical protein
MNQTQAGQLNLQVQHDLGVFNLRLTVMNCVRINSNIFATHITWIMVDQIQGSWFSQV